MTIKIPADIPEAITEIARRFGHLGGKTAAKNMTREERLARAVFAELAFTIIKRRMI